MKEISIEEKAQRFDEAINTIRNLVKAGLIYEDAAIQVFPELKESEDEKIRKTLIKYFRNCVSLEGINGEDISNWLEKQGEQKSVDDLTPQEAMDIAVAKCFEEGEQKPVDKVEPKFNFKVSQWIVATGKCVYLIAKIDGFNVTLVDTNGDEYVFDTSSLNDAHEWTIQDAKDGDVLEFEDHGRLVTGILSFVNKTTGKVDVSCLLEGDKFKVGVFYNLDTVKPHPATKEQRDQLEKAMTDAGYTFDFEKKELKKIEHEPTEKWYDFIRWFVKQRTNDYTLIPLDDDIHKWGDNILNHARKVLEQNTAEWSKEEQQTIKDAASFILSCVNTAETKEEEERLEELADKLQDLRPQNRWKPSDEQMKALKEAVDEHFDIDGGALWHLYEDLKKLK